MFSSLGFTLSGFIFTLFIAIVYLTKKRYNDIENSLFRFSLIWTLFLFLLEVFCVYMMSIRDKMPVLCEVACRSYIFGCVVWFVFMIIYVWALGNKKEEFENHKLNFFKEPFVIFFSLLGIISFSISCFLPITFTSGIHDELYVIGGKGVLCLYIVFVFIGAFLLYMLIFKRKKVSFYKRLPMFFFLVFYFVMLVFQQFYTDINDLTFMFGLTVVAVYFTVVSQDYKLASDLEVAKAEAEKANNEKTEFLSKMSHEIRTPMNAIMGFSETLMKEEVLTKDKMDEDVKNIYEAANNLIATINNILDVSKIDAGKERLDLKNFSIENIVFGLMDFVESRIDTSQVKFNVEVSDMIPATLYGDNQKIYKILLNILTNSIKFTPSGEINFKVSAKCDKNMANLEFLIQDTGIGIKDDDIEKVFTQFAKIDTGTPGIEGGSGLGLNVAKKLIELLGGTIDFKSEYGVGTVFAVSVNVKIVDYSSCGDVLSRRVKMDNSKIDCTGKRVLVVDDNKLNLKVAHRFLRDYNMEVVLVESGYSCIELLKRREHFDLIFLDHLMPDLDGIETIRIIKKMDGYDIPPIFAITANQGTNYRELYLREGFSGFLAKPIESQKLNQIINYYFKK